MSQISSQNTPHLDIDMSKQKEYKTREIPRVHKTTTIIGKREYMKRYMQIWRSEQKEENEN